jgi:hypothetical protein
MTSSLRDGRKYGEYPLSEVRVTPQQTPFTNFGKVEATRKSIFMVPLFHLTFLVEFAASGAGTSNGRHQRRFRQQGLLTSVQITT